MLQKVIGEQNSISSHEKLVLEIDAVGSHILPFPYLFRKLDTPNGSLGANVKSHYDSNEEYLVAGWPLKVFTGRDDDSRISINS